jgi:feruloyl-CoA synthase
LRALGGLPRDAHTAAVFAHDAVRSKIGERLAELAATSSGSATRVERAVLLDEPPSLDAGEITDKGSLNQRAVLARRAALVADAHRTPPPRHVMTLDARDGAGTPRRR